MSYVSMTLFTITFIAFSILVGDLYTKMHLSYNVWMIITVICTIIFVGEMVAEKFIFKKRIKD